MVSTHLELKEKLLLMASHAEAAVNRAVKALLRRDDELAFQTREDDSLIDRLEIEIDELALNLLEASGRTEPDLRQITTAMKIAANLERVGDEATTIARRALDLCREPRTGHVEAIPGIASQAIALLKDALDAFVNQDPDLARSVIPRDKAIDDLNRQLHAGLVTYMTSHPESIGRCLNLMVISKSLERIGDHATNIAEMVVYIFEGRDIRHAESMRLPAEGENPFPA